MPVLWGKLPTSYLTLYATILAQEAGIHPAHLSRGFPRYFSYILGQYVRHLRVQRALTQFLNPELSLLDIALACGLLDQCHFIRCFKAVMHERPVTGTSWACCRR